MVIYRILHFLIPDTGNIQNKKTTGKRPIRFNGGFWWTQIC